MRVCGPRVLEIETGEYVTPQALAELQAERTAARLEALRLEVRDRRPTLWRDFRELRERVDELERRLDALSK